MSSSEFPLYDVGSTCSNPYSADKAGTVKLVYFKQRKVCVTRWASLHLNLTAARLCEINQIITNTHTHVIPDAHSHRHKIQDSWFTHKQSHRHTQSKTCDFTHIRSKTHYHTRRHMVQPSWFPQLTRSNTHRSGLIPPSWGQQAPTQDPRRDNFLPSGLFGEAH